MLSLKPSLFNINKLTSTDQPRRCAQSPIELQGNHMHPSGGLARPSYTQGATTEKKRTPCQELWTEPLHARSLPSRARHTEAVIWQHNRCSSNATASMACPTSHTHTITCNCTCLTSKDAWSANHSTRMALPRSAKSRQCQLNIASSCASSIA